MTNSLRPDVFDMPGDPEAARLVSLIRAIVGCPAAQGYNRLTESGPIGKIVAFLREVDFGARRRLILAAGDRATADELALVNLLVESQGGDLHACRARATWLVKRSMVQRVTAAAGIAADALALAGVLFEPAASSEHERVEEAKPAHQRRLQG